MAKFRKRPVVIDAVQLTWQTWSEVCDLIGDFPKGMRGVYVAPNGEWTDDANMDFRIGLLIPTLEGQMLATEDDWIIKGVEGEFYPCKPDIFEKTYESVEDLADGAPVSYKAASQHDHTHVEYNDHEPLT